MMEIPLRHESEKQVLTISSQTCHIGGIIVVIYGLEEIRDTCKSVSCLWLLHPRLKTKDTMSNVASSCVIDWNSRPSSERRGLIAVSFDQRNHGSREIKPEANQSWKKGNKNHAIDSTLNGTAIDVSFLIDHLGSYILNHQGAPEINHHLVLGVSLGGHSAWQVLFRDKRITAGVVIIGSPDYISLMSNRAQLSHRESAGQTFLCSSDFPSELIKTILQWDPRGIIFGIAEVMVNPDQVHHSSLSNILDSKVKGKRILVCSGGEDKLVPYHCNEPMFEFFRNAASGWYSEKNFRLEEIIYPGVGHIFDDRMLKDSTRFVSECLLEL
ncbi:alpha/beta hydrolase fold-containing protein [Blumeria hordei DH14]|uniref:Alpha/beta hydrolase fold-containing protein n=1 Tax=Blumeria graminis f. sp. hordei (strain DH14) TaxID=546991 RepID=N1JH23_BLUG1|nr:alpha/beta hydrolase fold-containing protein [Blumeria hordei DH14]